MSRVTGWASDLSMMLVPPICRSCRSQTLAEASLRQSHIEVLSRPVIPKSCNMDDLSSSQHLQGQVFLQPSNLQPFLSFFFASISP